MSGNSNSAKAAGRAKVRIIMSLSLFFSTNVSSFALDVIINEFCCVHFLITAVGRVQKEEEGEEEPTFFIIWFEFCEERGPPKRFRGEGVVETTIFSCR